MRGADHAYILHLGTDNRADLRVCLRRWGGCGAVVCGCGCVPTPGRWSRLRSGGGSGPRRGCPSSVGRCCLMWMCSVLDARRCGRTPRHVPCSPCAAAGAWWCGSAGWGGFAENGGMAGSGSGLGTGGTWNCPVSIFCVLGTFRRPLSGTPTRTSSSPPSLRAWRSFVIGGRSARGVGGARSGQSRYAAHRACGGSRRVAVRGCLSGARGGRGDRCGDHGDSGDAWIRRSRV